MDTVTTELRSKNMAAIKATNTKPEIAVRKILHKLGYRYSLHKKTLPGKPDIYLKKYKTVIFVHGCFWHQHKNCKDANIPKSNLNFWIPKLKRNEERDILHIKELQRLGYNIITFWQCEVSDKSRKKIKTEQIIKKLNMYIPNKNS